MYGDLSRDGQAQSESRVVGFRGRSRAIETVKYTSALLLCHARTAVLNGDLDPFAILLESEANRTSGPAVFHRVRQQFGDGKLQQLPVRVDFYTGGEAI